MFEDAPDATLLDSLPYYDRDLELQPQLRARVTALLPASRGAVASNDPRLPPPADLFTANPLLREEVERVAAKKPLSALDTSRHALPAPPAGSSEEAWAAALSNAKAQLEHQFNRQSNISLLQTYGANAWKVANYRTEAEVTKLEKEVEAMKEDVTRVNRERKNAQTTLGKQLTSLETRWTGLISNALQIELANVALEAELEGLRIREEQLRAQVGS